MDLVSVIIPYYKKRNFVKETILSVIDQSYDFLEILIIYDDTNLNDLEFLQKISKLDNRIKIINNNKRLGAGLSRNKGIEQSNGKYIAFIDADDTWAPDKLKDQISFMKKNNYQISHTSYEKKVIVKTNTKFPQLVTKEDFVFWLSLLKINYKFYAFDSNLTNWTDSKNSLSSNTIQKLFDGFKVYNYYMNFNIIKSFYYLICLGLNYLKKK